MHRRGIIHGNIKIVRRLSRFRFVHAFRLLKENILVDGDGNARIGGLGSVAIHPSTQTADMDQFLRGAALEAADPRLLSVGEPGASKESDISAFGTLAWQVSMKPPESNRQSAEQSNVMVRYSQGVNRAPVEVSSRGCIQYPVAVSWRNPLILSSPTVCGN